MKQLFFTSALITAMCFFSCSSGKTEKEMMIARIDSLQKSMFDKQAMELNKELASEGMNACLDFIKKYPQDTLSAEYLFNLADLSKAMGNYLSALEYLKRICKEYPSYKKIPECLFLQGYYYDEYFNDTIHARQFYNLLIAKYPKHPFADDAQALMNMFGKSDEEIIREFEKNVKN